MPTPQQYRESPLAPNKIISTTKGFISPTQSDIEGPFYKPYAPNRTDIRTEKDEHLPILNVNGLILDTMHNPIKGAIIEFWQADKDGAYDNIGFDHRGRQQSDNNGHYELITIRPGDYDISDPNDPLPHEFRCAHIHVKISANGFKSLTTQLYFIDDQHNRNDRWFSMKRVLPPDGRFDFILGSE